MGGNPPGRIRLIYPSQSLIPYFTILYPRSVWESPRRRGASAWAPLVNFTVLGLVFRLYLPGMDFPDREIEFRVKDLMYHRKLVM